MPHLLPDEYVVDKTDPAATSREMVFYGLEKAECPSFFSELSPLPKGTRAEITLETKRGPQQIQAWSFSGRLCVHRSIARISGYTVSHQPSGHAVLTSIHDKAAAFDLVRRCWLSAKSTGTRTGRSRIRPRSTPCSRSANFSSAPTHYVNCSLVQSARASNWSSSWELGKSAPAPPCRPHLSS